MKSLVIAAMALALPATAVIAQQNQTETFGNNYQSINVKDIKNLADDSLVEVTGKITKRISGEDYEFSDSTGTIAMEIDQDVWQGLQVTANDTVRVRAEVDKDWHGIELEAEVITVVETQK